MGVHKQTLAAAFQHADEVCLYQPNNIKWKVQEVADQCPQPSYVDDNMEHFVAHIVARAQSGDQILVMSNGGFEGIHAKLLQALEQKSS